MKKSNYNMVPFEQAKQLLQEGDVLLCRGRSWSSFLIGRASEGKYSHAAVASAHGDNGGRFWECIEFKEWKGGRTIALARALQDYPDRIDVFRPVDTVVYPVFNPETNSITTEQAFFSAKCITNEMRKMTGLPYGWKRIWWVAQHKLPFLRFFYDMDDVVDDSLKGIEYPVCSTAVAYSFNKCHYDLVPMKNDNWIEPSDLSRSSLLRYIFTIQT